MITRAALMFLAAVAAGGADGVLDRVAAHADRFGQISRQIWETPELGYHEVKSSPVLQAELKANGFEVKAGVANMPTAFVAQWGSGKPVIALMGEFDALPGMSQKEEAAIDPVTPGAPGHACGHNLLGSASALAAVAIKEEMQARGLKGTIRYYGTPAEEGGGGKIYMIHAGLLKDVDAMIAWHPGDSNRVNNESLLAVNGGRFKFYGVASHAAAGPDRGRSALDGVMIMANAIEFLREHVPQETRIHYIISNGGQAPNIVPAFAELNLMARNPDAQVLNGIFERIMDCAKAGALASGTRMEFEQGMNVSNVLPNDTLTEVLGRAMQKAGGYSMTAEEKTFAAAMQKTLAGPVRSPNPDKVTTNTQEGTGYASTDAGDVSWVVPMVQFSAATFVPGVGAHTWQAAACAGSSIGRKGMVVAARTMALGAMELFEKPEEVAKAKDSFETRLAGRKWTTRIAPDSKPPYDYATK